MAVNFNDANGNVISSFDVISGLDIVSGSYYDHVVVAADGSVTDAVVSAGGKMFVQSSGKAESIIVKNGGNIFLQTGAAVFDLVVEAGGKVGGFSFGSDSYWTNAPGGALAVGSKIVISSTEELANKMHVYRGASAVDITAENAEINQENESELSNTVINHGGKYFVEGNTVNAAVNNEGYIEIKENGNAAGMTVNSGGSAAVFGSAENVVVNGGGHFGGYIFSSSVEFGKIEQGSGALADRDVTIKYRKDEKTYDLTIGSGAELNGINAYNGDIYVNGSAGDVTIAESFILDVNSTGKVSGVSNNGNMLVVSGGSAADVTNFNLFYLDGKASDVTNNHSMFVDSNGDVTGLSNYYHAEIAGKAADVTNAASMFISAGGSVSDLANSGSAAVAGTVNGGTNFSSMTVAIGGVVNSFKNAGNMMIFGSASDFTNTNSAAVAGTAENVTNSGELLVMASGTVAGLSNTGKVELAGSAADVVNSGNMIVLTSANINGIVNDGTVELAGSAVNVTNNAAMNVSAGVELTAVTNNNGTLAMADHVKVNGLTVSGGIVTVAESAVLNDSTLVAGGTLNVADSAAINSLAVTGGAVNIGEDAKLTSTTIVSGGTLAVGEGAELTDLEVSGGTMTLNSATSFVSGTVDGGSLRLYGNVTADSLTVSSGAVHISFETAIGNLNVAEGVELNGFIFGNEEKIENTAIVNGVINIDGNENITITDDRLEVTGNGTVMDNLQVTYGHFYLTDSASADNTSVENIMRVSNGAYATDTAVTNNGAVYFNNASGSGVTASSGGEIYAEEGSVILSVIVDGGKLYAKENAQLNSVNVSNGSILDIGSGVIANDITLENSIMNLTVAKNTVVNGVMKYGDTEQTFALADGQIVGFIITESSVMNVGDDGRAYATTVNAGGLIFVSAGGNAFDTTVDAGGYMHVSGSADGIDNSGRVIVSGGGEITSTTVSGGGTLHVQAGASANINSITSGASLNVEGSVSNTTVNAGGSMTVAEGATAINTVFSSGSVSGGVFEVYGNVTSTTIDNHSINIFSGANASSTTITSGTMTVSEGASAVLNMIGRNAVLNVEGSVSNTTVNSGGQMTVSSGAAANTTEVNNAVLNVEGSVSNTTVNSGGQMTVASGASADSNTINSTAALNVEGTVTSTTVNAGGQMIVESTGSAVDTTLYSGSALDVYGSIKSTTASGRAINLHSGATASITTITNGSMTLAAGASATDTAITDGLMTVSSGASANITEVNDARLNVEGTVTSTTVNADATLNVSGSAINTTVNTGGLVKVSSEGSISSTTISSGASVTMAGGSAYNTIVEGSGAFTFDSDSIVDGTTVCSGAEISVVGVISNTKVYAGGSMYIAEKAVHKGTMNLEDGVDVSVKGTIDFTLTGVDHSDDMYQINNLSLIKDTPTYTITIQEGQFGVYELAQKALGFDETITVNVIGDESTNSFTLTANGERYFYENNGSYYELDLSNSGDLTLTVQMPEPIYSPSTLEPTKDNVYLTVIYPVNVMTGEEVEKYYRVKDGEWTEYKGPIVVEENATYEFKAKDGDFISYFSEYTVSNIDRTPPAVVVSGNMEDYGKEDLLLYADVNDESPYTIEYSYDNGISWDTMKANSLTVGKEYNFVNFRVTDKAGNVTLHTEQFTDKDDAPTVEIDYNKEWTNKDIVITKTNDDKLLYSYDYAEKGAFAVWYEFNDSLIIEDVTILYFKAVDQWGNESPVKEVEINNFDRVKPMLTVYYDDTLTAWTAADLTVTVEAYDDNGVGTIQCSKDGGMTWEIVKNKRITVEQNCDLIVKVSDEAGNETISYVPITKIDKELPTVSVKYNDDWAQKVTVTIDASDSISGIASMEYTIDGGISWNVTDKEFSITDNSTVSVRVTDNAGNQTLLENIEITNIDRDWPSIDFVYDESPTYDPVEILIEVSDNLSGIKNDSLIYSTDGFNWHTVENNRIIADKNGIYYFQVKDNAGNVRYENITIDNIKELDIVKNDLYNKKVIINNATDLALINDIYSYKPTPKAKETDKSKSYKLTVSAKGSLTVNDKDTGDVFFNYFSKVNVSNADIGVVSGGKSSESRTEKLNKKNELTKTVKTSQSASGRFNAEKSDVSSVVNYSTVSADASTIGKLEISAQKFSTSEKSLNGVLLNSSSTFVKSAAGKVTLKNGASVTDIINYKTVKLESGSTAGNISLEAYTEKITNKSSVIKTVRTNKRIGSLNAKESIVTGNISGYKTVKLTDSTVKGNVIITDVYKVIDGVKTKKLTGSVNMTDSVIEGKVENYSKITLKNSSVEKGIANVRKVSVSKGFNFIDSYVGTEGKDTLTISKNAVLTLNNLTLEGNDKLVLNGTLVLGSAFEINAATTGSGDFVATNDVYQQLKGYFKPYVLNLGQTTENFVSEKSEFSDNTEKKADKWDLKSDYKGWLGNYVDVNDTVDFVKFKSKESGSLMISGDFGEKDVITFNGTEVNKNAEGKFIVEYSAKVNNILMFERNEDNSMSYSISLIS